MQTADLGNAEEIQKICSRIELVMEMLEEHAMHEDRYIITALEAVVPGSTQEYEQEYRALRKSTHKELQEV